MLGIIDWTNEKSSAFEFAAIHKNEYHLTVSKDSSKYLSSLVLRLVGLNIAFKIINNGASVKTITNQVDVCPKCGGKGVC